MSDLRILITGIDVACAHGIPVEIIPLKGGIACLS